MTKLSKKFVKRETNTPQNLTYDISAICTDIRRKQAESGRKVVTLPKQENKFEKVDLSEAA